MKVWLDDERPAPVGWICARTVREAIRLLATEQVEEMSLDHDLGDFDDFGHERTGYDVLLWIEECATHRGRRVPRLHVHTSNPPARKRMEVAIRTIERLFDREERS